MALSFLNYLGKNNLVYSYIIKSFWYQFRKYTPRRAILYVPGDDERKIKKSINLSVDSVVFDCEDGVAMSRKAVARQLIRNTFEKYGNTKTSKAEWAVRINPVDSEYFEEDMRIIFSGQIKPKTVCLPKVHHITDIIKFHQTLEKVLNPSIKLNLLIFTESCHGVLNLRSICETAEELSRLKNNFKLDGIIFGSDDYCSSIGITRSESSIEILYARQYIIMMAKAFNIQAIDMVFIDFRDPTRLRLQSEEGYRYGYTGKQVIHPDQIEIVQTAMTPSKDKIAWAEDLLSSFEKYHLSGKGAFVYKNQMIDMPTIKQARNIIDTLKIIK